MSQELTQDYLKSIIEYDQDTGVFTWKKRNRHHTWHGKTAGSKNNQGYIRIQIDNRSINAHRLAWLYVYGYMPRLEIDHINRNRSDNRICNLREADRSLNNSNTSRRSKSSSKYLGVHKCAVSGKWKAQISVRKKKIYLGMFENEDDASSAYLQAREKYQKLWEMIQ